MKTRLGMIFLLGLGGLITAAASSPGPGGGGKGLDTVAHVNAHAMITEGRHTFRFDTFGDEAFWGDALQLHQAIAGARNGGVGPGLSPKQALSLGLRLDVESLHGGLLVKLK